jgi:hypothetical protein
VDPEGFFEHIFQTFARKRTYLSLIGGDYLNCVQYFYLTMKTRTSCIGDVARMMSPPPPCPLLLLFFPEDAPKKS